MKFALKFTRLILAALVVSFAPILSQQNIFAQEKKAAPSHVHYTEPAQQGVSPTGALAPRLQKLGNHTFPVSTKNPRAQLFMVKSGKFKVNGYTNHLSL